MPEDLIKRKERQKRWREKNKIAMRQYEQGYRQNIQGRFCACGNAASLWRDGDWICTRCNELQQELEAAEARRKACGFVTTGMQEYRLAVRY